MVVKSRNSTKIKITHFDTVVAQGYERLKVNIDQTLPQLSEKNAFWTKHRYHIKRKRKRKWKIRPDESQILSHNIIIINNIQDIAIRRETSKSAIFATLTGP